MMDYVAVFFTNLGAMKFKKYCEKTQIEHVLMPVPRVLSSNCNVGAKFSHGLEWKQLKLDDMEKLFIIENGDYRCVYKSPD